MDTPFPIIQKFNYPKFEAITFPTGGRVYTTPQGDRVPSVTTILGKMLPKDGILKWREDVGEEEADRIFYEAGRIGTTMHDMLEGYVSNYRSGRPDIPPQSEEDKEAKYLADNIRRYALLDLTEVWGIEEALYYDKIYAGRTDLIGVYKRKSAIIDYKNARRLKEPEWIEGYKLQIAAYNMCHRYMFNEDVETGIILIAIRQPCKTPIQQVILKKDELAHYEEKWVELVAQYYQQEKIPL